jgi:hypothetical protein
MNEKKHEATPEQFEKLANIEKTATSFMNTITDFATWCTANIDIIDVEECTSIYEDFVKSNEHIVQKIYNVMPK